MASAEGAAAVLYRDTANVQYKDGKKFVEEISPKSGDIVLDIGCGTGGVTAHLAEFVGQHGKVTGVDPDGARIKLAQATYQQVENLTFVEGDCVQFPDVGLEKYDLIFSNYVFHWIFNKEEAIKTAYRSLKPGGRIAFQFNGEHPLLIEKAFLEFFPEHTKEPICLEEIDSDAVEQYFRDAGFDISKLHRYTWKEYFDTLSDFFRWLDGTSPVAREALITEERLEKFVSPMEDGRILLEAPVIQIVGTK